MTLAQSLLWPLSVLYGATVHLRNSIYRAGLRRAKRLNGVAISVGNLTVGGTGKTPMVCWLATRAAEDGKKAGILTRGYRGSACSSDEVEMLRNRLGDTVQVGVGADRYAKGMELERVGVNWFILDDGFQHHQLARDVDLVLIDASNPFGGGHLLPAGRLREPVSALHRADVVVITRSSHAPAVESVVRRYSNAPISYAQTKLEDIIAIGEPAAKCENFEQTFGSHSKKFFAFCGIGNPKAFFADLRRWNLLAVGTATFRDHHHYTQEDMNEIERKARAAGAEALLCTEKDGASLKNIRAKELPLFCCKISLDINQPVQFWKTIVELAAKKHQQASR